MPHISEMKESKFLKKEDCGAGILVTISGCEQMNVGMENQPPDHKWCLTFNEPLKPMVLNSTNAQLIAAALGSENSDDWIGRKIVLYNDPSVSYQGKLIGGIRARAPRGQAAAAPKPAPKPVPQKTVAAVTQGLPEELVGNAQFEEDSIPF